MVNLVNVYSFSTTNLTNYILVKGGTSYQSGIDTKVLLPVPTTDLNGRQIIIRKCQNMGNVNINVSTDGSIYTSSNNIIPNNSITATNTINMSNLNITGNFTNSNVPLLNNPNNHFVCSTFDTLYAGSLFLTNNFIMYKSLTVMSNNNAGGQIILTNADGQYQTNSIQIRSGSGVLFAQIGSISYDGNGDPTSGLNINTYSNKI
jgi:hypothetical protein